MRVVLFVAGAALYAATVLAVGFGSLMQLLTSLANGFGFGLVALVAAGSALRTIAVAGRSAGPVEEDDAGGSDRVLVLALAWGAANAVVFGATLATDAFVVFRDAYLVPVVVAAPVLVLVAAVLADASGGRIGTVRLVGLAVWLGSVAVGHLWVVAMFSTGV